MAYKDFIQVSVWQKSYKPINQLIISSGLDYFNKNILNDLQPEFTAIIDKKDMIIKTIETRK